MAQASLSTATRSSPSPCLPRRTSIPGRASLPAWPRPASRPLRGLTFPLPPATYVHPWTQKKRAWRPRSVGDAPDFELPCFPLHWL